MAVNYAYHYAQIDPETNMCMAVLTTTAEFTEEELEESNQVVIPVYDEEYLFKYYINGNWYEDEAGTIPWSSSLI